MKVSDIDFAKYPHKTVLVITPKNYNSGMGATFPEGSDEIVKRIYAAQDIAEEGGIITDAEGIVLTLRIKNEFYPY